MHFNFNSLRVLEQNIVAVIEIAFKLVCSSSIYLLWLSDVDRDFFKNWGIFRVGTREGSEEAILFCLLQTFSFRD